jgi:hypothetical protein
VTELDHIRVALEDLPGPDAAATARAREALRGEVATVRGGGSAAHRVRLVAFGSVAVAVLVVAAALSLSSDRASFGVRIAAAASEAIDPRSNDLVHSLSRTTVRVRNRSGSTISTQTDDSWSTTAPPTAVDRRTDAAGRTTTTLASACGWISYDPESNLFTVTPATGKIGPVDDPVAVAANAIRTGRIDYRGKLTYRGIPAAKLVVTQYGATTTYIVRRDTGYPLVTIARRITSRFTLTVVTTYSVFEHVPRTPQSTRHVALTAHPGAFVVRTARASSAPGCSGFGSLAMLTRGGNLG